MTVRRVHPSLIDSNNTSDGSVLIYSAANGVVEFGAASGGVDVANAWVNANDYSTLLSAQSNDYATLLEAKSNDYSTLLEAQSNDYSTYLQAQSNDYSTLLEAQSNDYATLLQAHSNDYSTYTTLEANIYDTYTSLSANIGGSVSNDWVNANDYTTYLQSQSNDYSTLLEARSNDYNTYLTVAANTYNTLLTAQANDYTTYLAVTNLVNTVQNNVDSLTFTVDNIDANVYNTYTNLSQLVDTVQDNVAALSNTSNLVSDQYIISSTNTFTLSSSVNDANNILVAISGVLQSPNDDYVVTGTTLTINNTKPLTTGVDIEVRHLRASSGISALESWSIITSNTVLSADNGYFVDVTSSPISVTLPATPTIGNRIRIIDVAGLSEINQLTVIGNGEKIQRSNTNLEVASNSAAFTLIYSNSTYGWILGEI